MTRRFLPLARSGLGAALPAADPLGPGLPGRAGVPLTVGMRDGSKPAVAVTVPLRLNGPGDVTGLDSDQIVRVEPSPGTPDFEPNYFALVELRRPELPWLFTPAKPDAEQRLRPWLVLVVLEEAAVTIGPRPGSPLAVLDTPRAELPVLRDSWAWAHVQETSDEPTVARIVCPRRLRPGVAYVACLVPAFASGRRAGLGEPATPADDAGLEPAWIEEEQVRLPVYHHWRFATGAGGDFEALAARLYPRTLPPTVGARPMDTSAPGWGVLAKPRAPLPLTGALRPAGRPPELDADVEPELRTVLRGALTAANVPPPLYGEWYTREPGVPADAAPAGWLRDLNLDPRTRVAAGLGTQVVRYEQERLMASAWEQLAVHEQTEAQLTRTQLAEEVAAALDSRGFAPSAGDPALRRMLAPGGAVGSRLAAPLAAPVAAAEPTTATEDGPTEIPRFAPTFEQPMYAALRDWFDGMLLAGLGDVPPNTVALLETNPRFVEAFLVGLNHEFSRELMWRGFPTDRRGTYFNRFWEGAGAVSPMRGWNATSRLGTHTTGGDAAAQLVLLLRGDLLARYPRTRVYAAEATWAATGRGLGSARFQPTFRGHSAPDVTFLGFPLSAAVACGSNDRTGHPGWFFVVEEPPGEARFGFDESDAAGRPPAAVASWSDLTWADVGTTPGAYATAAGALGGIEKTERTGATPGVKARWGRNAAHMAVIAQQRPFRVAIHARAWLEVPPA